MVVQRVFPEIGGEGREAVFLNQELTVYFNHRVEPMSVNDDTFRVVDQNGNRVEGRLRVGLRSITFEPVPPVSAELDDGSFEPGGRYRLEIAGLPLWNAVRSRTGERLDRGVNLEFEVVGREPAGGHATPFLPVQAVTEPFRRIDRTAPHVAVDIGSLDLHFNMPVLPTSATADALQVWEVGDDGSSRPLEPRAVRVSKRQLPQSEHFGSTVTVDLGAGRLSESSLYFLILQGANGETMQDYLGRSLTIDKSYVRIEVVPGDRARVLELGRDEPWRLSGERTAPIGFSATRHGDLAPRCGVQAGAGTLGWLRPKESITIRPGIRFDRGDGVLVAADRDFPFLGVDVREGVTVTFESVDPIQIRSIGDIRVRGRLVLATPLGSGRWLHGGAFRQGESVRIEQLLEVSGCTLIAGGDVKVSGAIEHLFAAEAGSPLSVVSGGELAVSGPFPAQSVLGLGRDVKRITGLVESPTVVTCNLDRGLPTGTELVAESWTEWIRLRPDHPTSIDVELIEAKGDIEVSIQVAPPHSVDPNRPDLAAHRLTPLTSIEDPVELPTGAFVRFRIAATVGRPGSLPGLGAIRAFASR